MSSNKVKKITLAKKIGFKGEKLEKARETVIAEIEELGRELVSEVVDIEKAKSAIELMNLNEIVDFGKTYLKSTIDDYLQKVEKNYKTFLAGKETAVEKAEIVAILLYNQQLFLEIDLKLKSGENFNSSIADVMNEIYQKKKQEIDQSVRDLVLVKNGLVPQLQLEAFSLVEKITELREKLEIQSTELTQNRTFLQVAMEEIESLENETGELYHKLGEFAAAEERFAKFEQERAERDEQISGLKELIRQREIDIDDREKEINRLQKELERTGREVDKEQQAIAAKALEALNLFDEKQRELEKIKRELREKEKQLAKVEADIGKLTQEIAEKDQRVTSLLKRISDLTNSKDKKEKEATIRSFEEQLRKKEDGKKEAENKRKRAEKEKEVAEQELTILQKQSEELTAAVTASLRDISEQLVSLQQTSQKYEKMLVCLGITEKDFSGDLPGFWEKWLGKNVDGKNTTFFDIKNISGIESLQGLLDEVVSLRNKVSELSKRKGHDKKESLVPIVIGDIKDKSLAEEMRLNNFSFGGEKLTETTKTTSDPIEEGGEKEEEIKSSTIEELKEELRKKEDYTYFIEEKKGDGTINKKERSLIIDTLELLDSEEEEESKLGIRIGEIIREENFERLGNWVEELRQNSEDSNPHLIRAVMDYYQKIKLTNKAGLSAVPETPALTTRERQLLDLNGTLTERIQTLEKNSGKEVEELGKSLQKFQTQTGYSLEELDIYFTNNNHTTRQIIERYKKGLKLIAQQLDPEGNLLREEEENYTKAVSEKAVEKLEDLAKLQEAVKKLEEILQSFMKEVAEKFAKDWTEKSYEGQEGSARLAIYKENCDNLRNKLQKLIGKSDSHSSRDDTKERDSSSTKNSELETEKNGPQSKVTEAGKNNENLRKTNQQLKLATGICGLVAVISIGINFVRKSKPAEPRRIRRTAVEN